jgi:hypothetical protein
MNPTRGYYSLIQYCPDLSRLEAVNVGVALFCPEPHFLGARTTTSVQRIRRFFGSQDHDWEQVRAAIGSVEERFEAEGARFRTLEELERFIATRGNEVQLTPPRPVKVFDPAQDLELLFERLVGGRRGARPRRRLEQRLEETLGRPELAPLVRRNVTVTVPALRRTLTVPFGFRNGRFNLIRPAVFPANESPAINRACRHAIEGRSLYEHADGTLGPLQLVVVGEFSPSARDTLPLVREILRENQVRLFTLEEAPALVEEVRTHNAAERIGS